MTSPQEVTGVLMVGSVPGDSARDVMTRLAQGLPGRLRAIPDGETGERWNYIGWQLQRFPLHARRLQHGGIPFPAGLPPKYELDDIQPTGYDTAAIASYAEFKALREQGIIPADGVRFQVCMPTPYNVVIGHVKPEVSAAIDPLYEERFMETLDALVAAIPAHDLIIQWDLCFEMTALEFDRGRLTDARHCAYFPPPVMEGLMTRVVRLCERIPASVPLAFHLCYGDLGHRHFVEPQDLGLCVEVANDLLARWGARIQWIHMPVPKERADAAYFLPLQQLVLPETTQLVLGLVHANDEIGTRKRLATAYSVYTHPFGIATECGLGRTPKEDVDSILNIARAVSGKLEGML